MQCRTHVAQCWHPHFSWTLTVILDITQSYSHLHTSINIYVNLSDNLLILNPNLTCRKSGHYVIYIYISGSLQAKQLPETTLVYLTNSLKKNYIFKNIPLRKSTNFITGTWRDRLSMSKNVAHGIFCCKTLERQWYNLLQGGRTSVHQLRKSSFNTFTRFAIRIYTSRRKLNPSPGLISYSKYLQHISAVALKSNTVQ